ncbi:hypothetical protein B7463_g11335, partial [Scytalidium lignicola]
MPLAPAVSALARKTIKAAFEELNQTITPADSRDFRVTTLQDVQNAALEIERQLAARGSLRNMRRLMPLFRGLGHYSKVVDVLCNGTPYLSWIWAPITLILQLASEYVEAFEQIIKGYSRIAASLGRFDILRDTFIGDFDFQQTLAIFYADILQFHKHAYKFVRRSGWKLLFLTSWGRFQRRFDNILEDMKRHESLIDQEANTRNIADAQKMRQDIRSWREQSLEQLSSLEEEQAAKQHQSIMSWLKIDESDQLAIFESISTEGLKHPGTCGWTLKIPKISSWLQRKPETLVLWLQGTVGSGKSVMSTQLVNYLQAAKMFVIHHFCTYSYASSTTYEQILKSLLLQLLRKDGDLVAHVYREFILGNNSPTVSALERVLQLLFKSMSHEPGQTEYVWIIFDGLDECETEKQARVVSLMNQIATQPSSSGGATCKVLISSRTSPVLSHYLRKKQTVSLSNEKEHLQEAIRLYASQRLQSLEQKFRQLHIRPGEIDEIERGIAKKADGESTQTSQPNGQSLSNSFYRKILTQILIHLDDRSISRIKCILGWIAFAKRPLKRLEFLSAVSFSSGDPEVDLLAPEYTLDICGPLIEERRDTTLAFIHVSVKEYLQSSSSNLIINEQEVLREHGIAAVTCFLSGLEVFSKIYPEQTKCLRVVKGLHGLHIYATEYWTEYILSHAISANGLDITSPLCILANQLAHKLDLAVEPTTAEEVKSKSDLLDERLGSLRQHPVLHKHVKASLEARSLLRLEAELLRYPPFMSAQSLKNHVNNYHNPTPAPRKSIRKVGQIPTERLRNNADMVKKTGTNSSPYLVSPAVNLSNIQSGTIPPDIQIDPKIAPIYKMNGTEVNMGQGIPNDLTPQQQQRLRQLQQEQLTGHYWEDSSWRAEPNGTAMIQQPPQQGPGQPAMGIPQQRTKLPEISSLFTLTANPTANGQPSSPQHGAAPPTRQQANKANPNAKKDPKDSKAKRVTKKASGANLNSSAATSPFSHQARQNPQSLTDLKSDLELVHELDIGESPESYLGMKIDDVLPPPPATPILPVREMIHLPPCRRASHDLYLTCVVLQAQQQAMEQQQAALQLPQRAQYHFRQLVEQQQVAAQQLAMQQQHAAQAGEYSRPTRDPALGGNATSHVPATVDSWRLRP